MIFSTIAQQTSLRLAEVGFALIAIAGGLGFLVALAPIPRRPVGAVAAVALAAGAVLAIVAIHWGNFGFPPAHSR